MIANYNQIKACVAMQSAFDGNSSHARVSDDVENLGQLNEEELERLDDDMAKEGLYYVVYSYDTPIAWVTQEGTVYVTKQRFSNTTSRLQAICRNYL